MRESELVYGDKANAGLLALVGPVSGRVLDVGCGKGPNAGPLRRAGADHLVGADPSAAASEVARPLYDEFHTAAIEDLTPATFAQPFDLIVAADVIEHLTDHWAGLKRLRELARPGARLAVSTPNVQTWEIVGSLLRGRWDYDPAGGLMDSTHLRWFTRSSLHEALRTTGWEPERDGGSWAGGARRQRLRRLTLGTLDDFFYWQLFTVARAV